MRGAPRRGMAEGLTKRKNDKVDNFAEVLGLPVEEIEAAATKEFKDAKAEKAASKSNKKGNQTHE